MGREGEEEKQSEVKSDREEREREEEKGRKALRSPKVSHNCGTHLHTN